MFNLFVSYLRTRFLAVMYTIGLLMQQIIYASESRQYDSESEDECSSSSDRASAAETNTENPLTETKESDAMTYIDLAVELYCYKAAETGMSDDAIGLYKKGVLEAKNKEDFSSILEALRNSLGQVEGSKIFRAIEYTVANYANDVEKLQCIKSVVENAEKIERPETICELLKIGICDANTQDDFLDVYDKLVTKLGPVNGLYVLCVINYAIAYCTKEETKIKNMLVALCKANNTDATETTFKMFKSAICKASDEKTEFKKLLSIMIDEIDFFDGGFVFEAINVAIGDYEKKDIDLLKKLSKKFVYEKKPNNAIRLREIFGKYVKNRNNFDNLIFMINENFYAWNGNYTIGIFCVINFITSDKKENNMKEMMIDLLNAENSRRTKFCNSDLTAEEFFMEFKYFLENKFFDIEACNIADETRIIGLVCHDIASALKITKCAECEVSDTKTARNKLQMLSANEKEYNDILNFIDVTGKLIKEAVFDTSKRENEEILALVKSKSCDNGEGLTLEEEKTMSFGCGEFSGSIISAGVLKYGFAALSVGVGLYKWFY